MRRAVTKDTLRRNGRWHLIAIMQINHWMYVAEIRECKMSGSWHWLIRFRDAKAILTWGQKKTQEEALNCASDGLKALDTQLRKYLHAISAQAR